MERFKSLFITEIFYKSYSIKFHFRFPNTNLSFEPAFIYETKMAEIF